jgi:hypothetical protein
MGERHLPRPNALGKLLGAFGGKFARKHCLPRQVGALEALHIIQDNGLRPAHDTWHYSWDVGRFCEAMLLCESATGLTIHGLRAHNEWAPVAAYTNEPVPQPLGTSKPEELPYWVLRLTSLEDFLARRSAASSRPGDHFPSRETYARAMTELACHFEHFPLAKHEARFVSLYDQLKHPRFAHSGEACWRGAIAHNPGVPLDWFGVSALVETASGICKAVQLSISDGRSCSGVNIAAARRNRFGYGVMLAVQEINQLCARGAEFFDCGVSGDYGGYKRQIFLDAIPTKRVGQC